MQFTGRRMKSKVIEECAAHGLGNPVLNDVVDELLRIAGIEVHDCALDYLEKRMGFKYKAVR